MGLEEHQLKIERTARYATLGDGHKPLSQVWFVCHGYGQLAREFIRHFEILDDETRLIVAPEALSRFYRDGTQSEIGASWMTREARLNEIDDYVGYLDALYTHVFERIERDSVEVFILGFSQGVATAARWVAHGTVHAEHLILWASLVPPEFQSREGFRRLRALQLTLVRGSQDSYLSNAHLEEQRSRLEHHGVTAREMAFEGGHRLDRETLIEIATDRKPADHGG
ncbi:MAG: phospholipase [Gemmatimonadetes bacterium]|nr:phospholipase [Gemmatimonadota bacterium]